MATYVCVVCPRGCRLTVEKGEADEIFVTGNSCPRGEEWGRSEFLDPRRTVTATCALFFEDVSPGFSRPRRLPVRTTAPVPVPLIPDLLADVRTLRVKGPVALGSVLLPNWRETGIDVVSTRRVE